MRQQEKRQYILTITLTLIALAIMVTYNFVTFYSNAVSNMIALGESSLEQETENLNGYLYKGMDVLQVTAITVEYMMQDGASPREIEAFLLEESERYKEEIDVNFTGIYGLFNGQYLDGVGWEPPEGYVPQEREWYIAAEEAKGKPTVVSPYLDAQTNTIMISVSKMLYDNESVISLDIALDEIQIITQDIQLDGMGYGFIIDKEGLVVAHSDEGEKGKNYLEQAEKRELLESIYEKGETSFDQLVNGEHCTVFTNVVMDDWYVSMIVSNTKLFHDIRSILVRNIIMCVVIFVLIFCFCTFAFRRIIWHMKKSDEDREKIKNLNDTMMRTVARTIDAKDRYTNGHSQRVAKYAVELARQMGKTKDELQSIYYAALLHDVGKIHIPDAIINKPAKLNKEEYAYIKLHPVSGYHILKDLRDNAMISQGAKWHHERYDGGGYPNGLSGENIPEIARIIGVADAYDAMTSNRSYRKIMPQEEVRREIENGIGKQFDPVVAKLMLRMIDEDTGYEMRQKDEFKKQILVVDDEDANVELIESIVRDEPRFELHKENSGEAALEFLKENEMDLILLDIQMPGMDGFDTYSRIRELSDVPVVFLAADRDISTINRASELGVEDYLIKPFMPEALLEILHSILQGSAEIEDL